MGFQRTVITIILPPLGVLPDKGFGWVFIISVLLTLFGYIPGLIRAFWMQTRDRTCIHPHGVNALRSSATPSECFR